MDDIDEIFMTIGRLRDEFEGLCVRGLRSAEGQQVRSLQALREEFERIGAGHLAGRIGTLVDAIRNDDRGAAGALLRAQSSLRVFERILTLEAVGHQLDERVTPLFDRAALLKAIVLT